MVPWSICMGPSCSIFAPLDGILRNLPPVGFPFVVYCTITYPCLGRVLGSILTDLKPLLEKIQRLEEVVTRDASIAHQQGIVYKISLSCFADHRI